MSAAARTWLIAGLVAGGVAGWIAGSRPRPAHAVAPPEAAEALIAEARAEALIAEARARGRWGDEQAAALRPLLSEMHAAQREAIVAGLIAALNGQEIAASYSSIAPF